MMVSGSRFRVPGFRKNLENESLETRNVKPGTWYPNR
jgi:hypothetical protein